jgi:plasmid replication initiation protein
MKRFIASILRKLLKTIEKDTATFFRNDREYRFNNDEEIRTLQKHKKPKIIREKQTKKNKVTSLTPQEIAARDMVEIMEVPFLALSKNRRNPINYESPDGRKKVKVTRHTGHFLASIYDWDIILFVAGRMQEIMNSSSDIPPRTMIFERHDILRSLHKHDGKKEEKDLKASLARLKLTGIETTVWNEDSRYESGFGFLDSWGYTDRKDVREIQITLSQWLYEGICAKGALLKVDQEYFFMTSALKRFLYRTARKHTGGHGQTWEFSVRKLYEKSGSEREYKKFKSDLKAIVKFNDVPGYNLEWNNKERKSFICFKNIKKSIFEDISKQTKVTSKTTFGGDITD